jgi:hypothetical protein
MEKGREEVVAKEAAEKAELFDEQKKTPISKLPEKVTRH